MHSYRIKLSAGFRNLGYPSGNPLIKSFASFVICWINLGNSIVISTNPSIILTKISVFLKFSGRSYLNSWYIVLFAS